MSHPATTATNSRGGLRRLLRTALPSMSLLLVLGAIAALNPNAISYMGFGLMLNLAIPILLATVAQMFLMCGNDLDLSIGAFVSFVSCISVTLLQDRPLLGAAVLLVSIAAYAALGALIHWRRLSSVIVTLGMSFVWQGLALLVLPQPGGTAPDWLAGALAVRIPVIPLPILVALVVAAIAHLILMGPAYGAVLRGAGGNPAAIKRAGWSLLHAKLILFSLGGLFAVLSGLALTGIATSADPNIGSNYTLLSIAGVILGGGEFVGGRVSPVGAVLGSLTLTLATSPLLTFLNIPPDWQIGANGIVLILVLTARALIGSRDAAAEAARA